MSFFPVLRRTLPVLALLVGSAFAAELSLERITADPPLAGRLPRQAELSPAGAWVSLLRPSSQDSEQLELWLQPAEGGALRRLVGAADLLQGSQQRLSEAEKMQLERRRISERGITSYQWCGDADQALLFPLSGDLYLARLEGGVQRLTHEPAAPKQDPRCAPDGRRLAYVKGGNLWVQERAGKARALSRDGGGAVSWGLAEFIAGEEFGRHRGFWWSPDSRRLLALRVDESKVPLKARAQIHADRTELYQQRYPAAGERNAQLSAWLIDARSGRRLALQLPSDAEYIVRAGWFADGRPWLQWMPRDQRRLLLAEFDERGQARLITEESDAAWVEVHDDLLELPALPRSGKPGLLWSSEASGRRQLLLLDRIKGERSPLTQLDEPVAQAVCAGKNGLVFAAASERGRSRDLFLLDTQGRTQALPGSAPRQWREAKGNPACTRLLETRSAFGEPPRLSLRRLDGGDAIALPGDAPDALLAQVLRPPLALDLLAADGRTRLNGFYYPPQTAKASPHPVITQVYGGPGSAEVTWAWDRDSALVAWWTRRGYGVFVLDTRGMANRDRDFTRAHQRAFGQVEVDDLFAAVRALPGLVPGVDAKRIGLFGWSYGGFLAARAMLDPATPFAAAVAVAPVTDWSLYDTAYTERYLGMPKAAEGGQTEAYRRSHLPSRAAQLAGPLLLVHGTADDNVLFEHSLRLIAALQEQGKLFETAIYPGKAHGIAGRQARLHLYRSLDAFFDRRLAAP